MKKFSLSLQESVQNQLDEAIAQQEIQNMYGANMCDRKETQRQIDHLRSKLTNMQRPVGAWGKVK